jgi:hypothetical protein
VLCDVVACSVDAAAGNSVLAVVDVLETSEELKLASFPSTTSGDTVADASARSAANVRAPATPSTVRPRFVWNVRTAA